MAILSSLPKGVSLDTKWCLSLLAKLVYSSDNLGLW